MNAVSLKRERDVHTVVDNQANPAGTRHPQSLFSFSIKISGRELLFAQLDQSRAAFAKPCQLFGVRESGKARVRNRVEFRQFELQV
jgi:hypothetical protein